MRCSFQTNRRCLTESLKHTLMKVQIKKIDPFRAAKLIAMLYAFLGVIVFVCMLFVVLFRSGGPTLPSLTGAFIFPVFYGVAGYVGGLIGAYLYNLVAGWTGGMLLTLELAEVSSKEGSP